MDAIKHSIQELSQQFNSKMTEFQQNLNSCTSSVPATSPTSHLATQFNTFRSFVMSALEGLQMQVQLLSKQHDQFEMRSRRKILLVHGVAEDKKENTSAAVIQVLSEHLKIPDLSVNDVTRCHRLGTTSSNRARAILVKFRDLNSRNQVWFSKTNLKNTGITLSEFLTKPRHEVFLAARQQFGMSKCWTRDGVINVISSDGKRHTFTSMVELKKVSSVSEIRPPQTSPGTMTATDSKINKTTLVSRTKRQVKK